MTESVPSLPTEPAANPSVGRIAIGAMFVLGWAVLHYLLFILLGAGGIVLDILVSIVKSIAFPGKTFAPTFNHWADSFIVGVVIAGIAGVPAGLAIVWRHKHKVLMRVFWITFFAGVCIELYALVRYLGSAFS